MTSFNPLLPDEKSAAKRGQCHPWGHSPRALESVAKIQTPSDPKASAQREQCSRNPVQFCIVSLVKNFLVPIPIRGTGKKKKKKKTLQITPHLFLSPQTPALPPPSSISADDFAFSCHGENRCTPKITSTHSHFRVYPLLCIHACELCQLSCDCRWSVCAPEAGLSMGDLDPPRLTSLGH